MSEEVEGSQVEDDGGSTAPEDQDDDTLPEHSEELGPAGNKAVRLYKKLEKEAGELRQQLADAQGKGKQFDQLLDKMQEKPELFDLVTERISIEDFVKQRASSATTALEEGDDFDDPILRALAKDPEVGTKALIRELRATQERLDRKEQLEKEYAQKSVARTQAEWVATQVGSHFDAEQGDIQAAQELFAVRAARNPPRTAEERDAIMTSVAKTLKLGPKESRSTSAPPATSRGKGAPSKKASSLKRFDADADPAKRREYLMNDLRRQGFIQD